MNRKIFALCALALAFPTHAAQPINPWSTLTQTFANLRQSITKEHVAFGVGAAVAISSLAGLYYYINKIKKPSIQINESLIPFAIAAAKSTQAHKKYMEDYVAVASLQNRFTIFGLYDGNGGSFVARALAHGMGSLATTPLTNYSINPEEQAPIDMSPLHHAILHKLAQAPDIDSLLKDKSRVTELFTQAFHEADAILTSNSNTTPGGSTGSIVLIDTEKNMAHIAHVGDSGVAIMHSNCRGECFWTEDHDYRNPDELARIENPLQRISALDNEGNHTNLFAIYQKEIIEKLQKNRPPTAAGLETSRNFGTKTKKDLVPTLIATPDVQSVSLKQDDRIIIASDGLWKVTDKILNGRALSITKKMRTLQSESELYNPEKDGRYLLPISTDTAFAIGNNPIAKYFASRLQAIGIDSKDDVTVICAIYKTDLEETR